MGIVVGVSQRAGHHFSKTPCFSIRLLQGLGVEGDGHAGATVQHRSRVRRDPTQPNLRQVHLVHSELFDELRDKGFTVAAGEHVAITGPSGAGKSTIAKLLVRLADPELGTIRLNGIEIRKMASAELRRQIALMTQDAPVFNDTVRANLLIGRPDADDEMLWRVLADVDLAGHIRTLPGGLDTLVGEAGAGFLIMDADVALLVEWHGGSPLRGWCHAPRPRHSAGQALTVRRGSRISPLPG